MELISTANIRVRKILIPGSKRVAFISALFLRGQKYKKYRYLYALMFLILRELFIKNVKHAGVPSAGILISDFNRLLCDKPSQYSN